MVFSPALLLLVLGTAAAAGNVVNFDVAGTYWCRDCSRFIERAREMWQKYGALKRVNFNYFPIRIVRRPAWLCISRLFHVAKTIDGAAACLKTRSVAKKLNIEKLKQCGGGIEGRKLLAAEHAAYIKTSNGLYWWPWTLLNGTRVGGAERNPWGEICKLLNPKPKECN